MPPKPPAVYAGLRWRNIGPFRGGRTVGAAGIPGQPNVFYIGVNNGGVWKTTDSGRTWKPIFDDQPTGSIGAIAVAPSDPNIIYVGSGEGLQRPDLSVGDGIYKSTDAGKTWRHLGLRDGQQISAHPRRSARSQPRLRRRRSAIPTAPTPSAASSAPPTAAQTWKKVLYKDENTGAIDLAFDPAQPAAPSTPSCGRRGRARGRTARGPAPAAASSNPPTAATPGSQLTNGLPTVAQGARPHRHRIAPSDPKPHVRLVDATRRSRRLYRSDDAGETWQRVNGEQRIWGRGTDFAEVRVDPKNPGRRLRRQHLHLPLHRRRQDLHRHQRRARRRRLPHHLDQSH